jgi:hypothetical protein
MQTGAGFTYQSLNDTLTVDGQYHDIVFPLAGIVNRSFVDTDGINMFGHANDLVVSVDSVIYTMVPEPGSFALLGLGALGFIVRSRSRKTNALQS